MLNRTITIFLLFPILTSITAAQVKSFEPDPAKVLMTWSYDSLLQHLGPGAEIIDTMYGQPYLSGYRYKGEWFGKAGTMSMHFSGERIARIQLSLPHPLVFETQATDPSVASDPKKRDSILRSKREQDSIWAAYLRNNPEQVKSLNDAALQATRIGRDKMRVDSLRSDSIIRQISSWMGTPFERDSSPPNESKLLFYTTWVNHGYVCAYRDYNHLGEISFTLTPLSSRIAGLFNLGTDMLVLQKSIIEIQNELIEIQLLGSIDFSLNEISNLMVLVDGSKRGIFLESFESKGWPGTIPDVGLKDVTGDDVPELIIEGLDPNSEESKALWVISLAYGEPIRLFEAHHDFQPESDIKEYQQTGVHFDTVALISYRWVEGSQKRALDLETRYRVVTEGKNPVVNDVDVYWKYGQESWQIMNYKLINHP